MQLFSIHQQWTVAVKLQKGQNKIKNSEEFLVTVYDYIAIYPVF